MKICTRGPIWSSFGSLAARSTFLTNLVVLSILPESRKHGRNYDFLEYPVLLPMFCNLNVDFQIWNANPDVKPCPACGMTSSSPPNLLMGSWWSIEALKKFNLMFIESRPENLHQRLHLEQFWQPGGQEHIFDQTGCVANSVQESQTEENCYFLDCFVILPRFCN